MAGPIVWFVWSERMIAKKKKAFTLIELLIVISVTAFLMAILMPVLAAASSQARSAVCRSNLRQLVFANTGYCTENDGFYVAAANDMWSSPGYERWHGVRDSLNDAFDPLRGPLVRYLSNGKVKECPEVVDFVKGAGWNISFEEGCGGYGYNMAYLGSRLWQRGFGFGNRRSYEMTTNQSEVGKPGATLMFADTAFYQQNAYLIEYSFAEPRYWVSDGHVLVNSAPSPTIHFRHRGWVNIGWADGHVGSREMGAYWSGNPFYTESAKQRLGWFEPIDNTLFDLK